MTEERTRVRPVIDAGTGLGALTEALAQREIETGLSAVCAWCTHYWEAREQAAGRPCACAVADCGGPAAGRAFPRYRGPRPHLATYCFICGQPAVFGVTFHGASGGSLGCCRKHEPQLRQILARRGMRVVVNERLVAAPKK